MKTAFSALLSLIAFMATTVLAEVGITQDGFVFVDEFTAANNWRVVDETPTDKLVEKTIEFGGKKWPVQVELAVGSEGRTRVVSLIILDEESGIRFYDRDGNGDVDDVMSEATIDHCFDVELKQQEGYLRWQALYRKVLQQSGIRP